MTLEKHVIESDLEFCLRLEAMINKLTEENMRLKVENERLKEENRKLKPKIVIPPAHKVKWIVMDDGTSIRQVDAEAVEQLSQYIKGRLLHD